MRLLMRANLKEAVSSLTASMQRSLLALLGISIGIGSVTAMVSVGLAVKGEARKQFESLGVDVLSIRNATRDAETGRRARGRSASRTPSRSLSCPRSRRQRPIRLPAATPRLAARRSGGSM